MHRFFDTYDDGRKEKVLSQNQYQKRVLHSAAKIVNDFELPAIIALQEVENRLVLNSIAQEVLRQSSVRYQTLVFESNDVSGITVAFLVKQGIAIKQARPLFQHLKSGRDQNPLFSRPPLFVEVCFDNSCLSLLNLHLRSMRGIRQPSRAAWVIQKRYKQASVIAAWVEKFQQSSPHNSLLLLGDFNALTPADPYLDVVGTIRGNPDNRDGRFVAEDLVNLDLIDLTREIPKHRRYSYIYRGKKQILDYMLINQVFKPALQRIEFGKIDYILSDHAPLIADFSWH